MENVRQSENNKNNNNNNNKNRTEKKYGSLDGAVVMWPGRHQKIYFQNEAMGFGNNWRR